MAETEQNKSEQATPYKLRRARERGQVARGGDLGFLSVVLGFSAFALLAGVQATGRLSSMMAQVLAQAFQLGESAQAPTLISRAAQAPLATLLTAALTIASVVILLEIIQIRGIVLSGHPLKPDFNRLNPAKNLKRLFSARMLIETLKSCAKIVLYAAALYFVISDIAVQLAHAPRAGTDLVGVWREGLVRLLLSFALLALLFAVLDQILARRSFQKQMRMSRSELNREVKDREGEPRQKQKRRRMHAEFVKQTRALSGLRGADVLIVNPDHYAVGLHYDSSRMQAPRVVARGRNRFALMLKQRAFLWSVLTVSDPPLARALYRAGDIGDEIPASQYRAVADLYLRLRAARKTPRDQDAAL